MIKQLIGRLTKPSGLISADGHYYTRIYRFKKLDWESKTIQRRNDLQYQYQEWKQTWYGKWYALQSWRETHKPL